MIFLTHDTGLVKHWQRAFNGEDYHVIEEFAKLESLSSPAQVIWIDSAVNCLPAWSHPTWHHVLHELKHQVVLTSSAPSDDEAISALDAGCVGYCHAFADQETLCNVLRVIKDGQVWVGPRLLQKLIKVANHAKANIPLAPSDWKTGLSQREIQVAELAANGATNLQIAKQCNISERTIKAHLSSIFQKMNVTDRLQMTLRVHGIS